MSHAGPSPEDFLKGPVHQFDLFNCNTVLDLLDQYAGGAFQGRNLAAAKQVWLEMLGEGRIAIFLALAGAMVPAGLGRLVGTLLEVGLIDGVVTTGANCAHDIVEAIGVHHSQIEPDVDDEILAKHKLNRVYDLVLPEEGFSRAEQVILDALQRAQLKGRLSTRRLLAELGQYLIDVGYDGGMVVAAARQGLPIFCPAIADSELGIDLYYGRVKGHSDVLVDVILDVQESAELVWQVHRQEGVVGIVTIGGGVPRNFIQQTGPALESMGRPYPGHRYGINITTDVPDWGGLSGSTFEEAISWRKYSQLRHATVRCDATIAFPLLSTAVFQASRDWLPKRQRPRFSFGESVTVSF